MGDRPPDGAGWDGGGEKRERSTVGEKGKAKRCLAKIFGLGLAELNGEKVLKRNILARDLAW